MTNPKLIASTFAENGSITLILNGEIILEGGGRIEQELKKNQSYQLSWKVEGILGSTYTITVSSPKEAEFHISKRLTNRVEKNQLCLIPK